MGPNAAHGSIAAAALMQTEDVIQSNANVNNSGYVSVSFVRHAITRRAHPFRVTQSVREGNRIKIMFVAVAFTERL